MMIKNIGVAVSEQALWKQVKLPIGAVSSGSSLFFCIRNLRHFSRKSYEAVKGFTTITVFDSIHEG